MRERRESRRFAQDDADSGLVSKEPQYRVAMCRMTLTRLRDIPQAERVLAMVSDESIDAMENARGLTWIPTVPFDQMADAMFEVLGPAGFRDFFAHQVSAWSETKLFKPLIEAAARIFGTDPSGHLKWLGRAWEVTTRNMGKMTATDMDGFIRVTYEGLPPSHRIERMVYSSEGSIRGVVESRGKTPKVVVDSSQLGEGRLSFDVSW